MPSPLEQSIFNTVRYFDIFDLPVTAVQIWRSLILDSGESRTRWGGQHIASLAAVRQALQESTWLAGEIKNHTGYFYLRGKSELIQQRFARHVLAQQKWKSARRVIRLLATVPFVRMLAGAGSLALDNPRPESDVDIFLVVRRGRIWTARLLLLIVTQLLGRRRKYWEGEAPDKMCLNHYVSEDSLAIAGELHNVFAAVLYTHLVPLYGLSLFDSFQRLNAPWLKARIMYPDPPLLPHMYTVQISRGFEIIKRAVESLLLEPIGNWLERGAEKLQRMVIAKHAQPERGGRVVVSDTELAFHPDSQMDEVLRRFGEDVGQRRLF